MISYIVNLVKCELYGSSYNFILSFFNCVFQNATMTNFYETYCVVNIFRYSDQWCVICICEEWHCQNNYNIVKIVSNGSSNIFCHVKITQTFFNFTPTSLSMWEDGWGLFLTQLFVCNNFILWDIFVIFMLAIPTFA